MTDAILIDRHYPAGKLEMDRLRALNEEFGPVIGRKRVQLRHVHLGRVIKDLLTAEPDSPTYFFPSSHPRAGQDRYDWKDRGDGVLEGTLVADDEDPAVVARLQAEKQEADRVRIEAYLATPEGRKFQADRLLEKGIIDQDEHAAMMATGSIHGEVAHAQ